MKTTSFYYTISWLFTIIITLQQTIYAQDGERIAQPSDWIDADSYLAERGRLDRIRQLTEERIRNIETFERNANNINSMVGMIDRTIQIASIYTDYNEYRNARNTLDAGECMPEFTQSTDALMPLSCPNNSSCSQCYKRWVEAFNKNRQTFAQAWCVYMNTKNFTDKAIAFGNNLSSAVPGSGLGWIKAKKGIDASYARFQQTYDAKYRELLTSLERNLRGIAACEQQYGIPDWYQRFGFMYVEFMQLKYKRPD